MILIDGVEIAGTRVTRDGYLVAEARVARSGIQVYDGREVGRPDLREVRVYRPEDEVFHADSLASYAFRPVTIDHPSESVGATNWKRLAVGQIGGEVVRDGGYVKVPLILMDKDAIETVNSGRRELSMGYDVRLDWTAGTTPDGAAYDAIQRDIRINHAAIVDKGRAGPECRLGDTRNPQPEDDPMTMKQVTIDGVTVELPESAANLIDVARRQNDKLGELRNELATKTADADKALSDKDAVIAAKDAEIADLKSKILTDAQVEALADARATLIDQARALADDVPTAGKSADEIRAAVVVKRMGDEAIKDKTTAQITAAFDALVIVAKSDPLRDHLRAGGGGTTTARDSYLAEQAKAWAN